MTVWGRLVLGRAVFSLFLGRKCVGVFVTDVRGRSGTVVFGFVVPGEVFWYRILCADCEFFRVRVILPRCFYRGRGADVVAGVFQGEGVDFGRFYLDRVRELSREDRGS